MFNVEVRRPKLNDFEELKFLFRSVITDTFSKENIAELIDDIENEIKMKINNLNLDYESDGVNRYFLLAIINQQFIGTIEYGPSSQLINELTNGFMKNIIEVGSVLIHPEFQKQGIGSLLMNAMLLTLNNKGIEEFCLDCGYINAQKYWKKKLGEPDYLLKNYWSDGSDHMIWRKRTREIPIIFKI